MRIHGKIVLLILSLLPLGSCKSESPLYKDPSADIEDRVEDLLSRMTLEEKIQQLNQHTLGENNVENNIGEEVRDMPPEIGSLIYFGDDAVARNLMQKRAVEESRLGIPILFAFDVIHGYRTIFPIPLAQACSWNPELARKSCEIAAQEAYGCGINWTFSPMVDVARDPRWGRVMESYGEDVYTNAVFCRNAVIGYQGDDLSEANRIAACMKHYVGYSASEAGRDYVPAEISNQTLWDTFLPPFEAGVKAGASTLMSAFHNINGTPATGNHYILTEILKERWGHDGFVVSDWKAIRQLVTQGMAADEKEAAMIAFNAGVEMDMVNDVYTKYLPELIDEGKVSMKTVDDAVSRVLRIKFRLGLFENPYTEELDEKEHYFLPGSMECSQQLAAESMVLLKNENRTLPLQEVKRIAVIGPLAHSRYDMMGNWKARGRSAETSSYLDGIKKEFPDAQVSYAKGCDYAGNDKKGFAEAVRTASQADVVVVCIGHRGVWSGENQSLSTIEVPEIHEDLLAAVEATGKPVVVLLASGRPLDVRRIEPLADAMIQTWHPGTQGGYAAAGLLSGRHNPSGKLAITFPYSSGQIPIRYNHRARARLGDQGLYRDIQSTPMYEFGYGLSYSEFEYGELSVSKSEFGSNDVLSARIDVKNISNVDGMETVHWFISDPYSHITRPVKELKFFEKKLIKAGETVTFTFEIDPMRDLGFVDSEGRRYLDSGEYRIIVGNQTVKINKI